MSNLGKSIDSKFRCYSEIVQCRVCGKEFKRKKNKLRGSFQLPCNRVTCSKECSVINLHKYKEEYQKEYRMKKKKQTTK